jgi:hypothetical protein
MTDESDGTIVLELADVVGELTRRHSDLLGCLRSLRRDLHDGTLTLAAYEPPPPRLVDPPPPRRAAAAAGSGAAIASRDSGVTSPSTVNGKPVAETRLGSRGDPTGSHRPLTKRHYDYFAELDDLLARLPSSPPPEETHRPLDS